MFVMMKHDCSGGYPGEVTCLGIFSDRNKAWNAVAEDCDEQIDEDSMHVGEFVADEITYILEQKDVVL